MNPASSRLPDRQDRGSLMWAACFAVLVYGLFLAEILIDFHPAKLSVFFILAFYPVLTFIHELGHAVVARLCGWRVCRIVVGVGREIGVIRVFGMPVELRLFPLGGYMIPAPVDLNRARVKSFLIYLAGPLAELALAVAVVLLYSGDTLLVRTEAIDVIALQSCVVAALIGVVTNLFPRVVPTEEGFAMTDGMGALRSFVLPMAWFESMRALPYTTRAEILAEQGRWQEASDELERGITVMPNDAGMLFAAASTACELMDFGRAGRHLRSLESRDDLSPEQRTSILRELILVELAAGSSSSMSAIEERSQELIALDPQSPRSRAVRGLARASFGLPLQGLELIREALHEATVVDDQDYCACLLTLAASRSGSKEELTKILAILDERAPEGWLYQWTRDQIPGN